ncbi:MAG: DUF115 domain-containing protein [Treponema sp.]|jgi:hypothetical protein|nr:DUF115 domain-containing protein [Treponema sp.]
MNDEIPRQIEARRGFSIFYRGKNLLSLIDPIAQAERIAGSVPPKTRTLYFCPSPLFGYGLSKLLAALNADSAILCVETDEKLMALSLEAMEKSLLLHPRLRYIRTRNAAALCAFVRETWGSRRFRRLEIIRLSGGWQLDAPLYEALAAALRRDIATDWGNAMTLVKLGRRYIRNAFRNMALIPDTPTLGGLSFGGRPVLVLGAGPSLDGLLEGLLVNFGEKFKENAGRPFAVICVDTCLLALLSRNIKPDLVVALESQHWNLRDFIGAGSQNIPLAMDLSALPATREVLGQVFLFVTPWTPLRIFERLRERELLPETLAPLGSVGLSAAALALRISSGPVIVGGIDFSFTLDRFHARNTPGHLHGLNHHNRLQPLITPAAFRPGVFSAQSKSGERVLSDPAMKNYRELFEQEFSREERLLDITGTGLPLGIKTLSQEAAFTLLQDAPAAIGGGIPLTAASEHSPKSEAEGNSAKKRRRSLETLIRRERESLITLRNILTGKNPAISPEETEKLLDGADYLWAHFPECAGAGGRHPPVTDISFLKRIRTEIDPFIGIFDRLLRELSAGPYRRTGKDNES